MRHCGGSCVVLYYNNHPRIGTATLHYCNNHANFKAINTCSKIIKRQTRRSRILAEGGVISGLNRGQSSSTFSSVALSSSYASSTHVLAPRYCITLHCWKLKRRIICLKYLDLDPRPNSHLTTYRDV